MSRVKDAGWTAEQARAALRSLGDELPQALDLMVGDAERRSVRLRTGAAPSYCVAQEQAALADAVVAVRNLELATNTLTAPGAIAVEDASAPEWNTEGDRRRVLSEPL